MQVPELIGGASSLGWVAVKAVLLFAVAVIGLRLGERRTLAQLSAFDFAVAVAIGAIVGRGATASDTSFATSAVALVTLLAAHRVVAIGRRHSRVVRLVDHPPRVLVARGELQGKELARAGLTATDVYALLRENGVGDLGQVGYLLYETHGTVTLIGADCEPGPLVREGLNASGYRRTPQARRAQQLRRANIPRISQAVPAPIPVSSRLSSPSLSFFMPGSCVTGTGGTASRRSQNNSASASNLETGRDNDERMLRWTEHSLPLTWNDCARISRPTRRTGWHRMP